MKKLILIILLYIGINPINYATPASSPIRLNLDTIELADTAEKQARGLMFRQKLCETCAMLFVYSYPDNSVFWMKNTQISLDIIFLDQHGKIVTIHKNTEPMNTQKTYSSQQTFWFVIETNAGFADINKLKPGDIIDVKQLLLISNDIQK